MSDLFSSFPEDATILIQGASRGLGLAFARHALADERVGLVVATSRAPQDSQALEALHDTHGSRLARIAMDVAEPASIAAAAKSFAKHDRPLHLLLNVAGVLHDSSRGMQPEKKLEDINAEHARYAFAVNALGPLLVAREFLPFLSDQRAIIANLSARVGSIDDNRIGGWYSYRASKAAQNMFTRTLAIELGRYRKSHRAICVALHPGTVETDLSAPFRAHVAEDKLFSPDRAARQLLAIIDDLDADDQGKFIAWDGQPIKF